MADKEDRIEIVDSPGDKTPRRKSGKPSAAPEGVDNDANQARGIARVLPPEEDVKTPEVATPVMTPAPMVPAVTPAGTPVMVPSPNPHVKEIAPLHPGPEGKGLDSVKDVDKGMDKGVQGKTATEKAAERVPDKADKPAAKNVPTRTKDDK